MSKNAITRRAALALGVSAVIVGKVAAAPVPKADPNASWVGKTVMPKKFSQRGKYVINPPTNDGGPLEDSMVLDSASYEVKAEKGTRVEVLHANCEPVWIEKEEAVQLANAVDFFTKALKENEKDTFAIISRGWAHHLLEQHDKALEDFSLFLKLTPAGEPVGLGIPQRWEGLVNRGIAYAEQGEFKKSLADLDEAVKGWPDLGIARLNRGYTYELMGDYAAALEEYALFRSALARNNAAWILATCPEAKFRDGAKAVEQAKLVCELTKHREGMYLDTLAAAYAEAGKFDDAVKTQEKALEDKSYVIRCGADAEKRLQLYKDKKPFRTEPVKK